MEYRKKAAEAAAKAAADAAKNDPAKQAEAAAKAMREQREKKGAPPADSPAAPPAPPQKPSAPPEMPDAPDSTMAAAPQDTLSAPPAAAAQQDTLPPPPDTTKVNFFWGSRRVRLFRRDMQMSADSLMYTELDSLARLYQNPILYNEGNRQYASDSIYIVIRERRMEKAHLLSNAFITIEEAPHSYDQIRGAEVVAYFDSTSALTRFDALGGAASLFYLEENKALATVNKVEAKMIYATFQDGEIERIYYYENPKNDGYPTVQLPEEDKTLKGFRWEPERRPASPLDVTSLVPRTSQRISYLAHPHAQFKQTETYFPGYISKVYRDIAIRDSLEVVRQRQKEELELMTRQEVETPKDTLVIPLEPVDSVATAPIDTLAAAPADTLQTPPPPPVADAPKPTPAELRKAERERAKAEREAQRKARWEELDRKDAEKKAAKEQKKLERQRAKKLKALRKLEKKAAKERARFEKYLRKEQVKAQKKNKQDKLI